MLKPLFYHMLPLKLTFKTSTSKQPSFANILLTTNQEESMGIVEFNF